MGVTASPHPGSVDSASPDRFGRPVVAVLGDGQLARMMQTAAIELGVRIRLLAGSGDASAAQAIAEVVEGDYARWEDVERVARGADVVTFDHEHVPNEFSARLIAEGVPVHPGPDALQYAQDKLLQRRRLSELGFPIPAFSEIARPEDLTEFWERVEGRVCLKARTGGYDGHGVWFPVTREEGRDLVRRLLGEGVGLLAEEKIAFRRELSAMVARRPSGEVRAWPVVESVQSDGICHRVIAPAPGLTDAAGAKVRELACRIAQELGVTGVLAVELFEDDRGVWVNELAMRPHNTGHWTQDGCVTDQFEQHLRAVLDLPLGSTEALAPVTVMANTLGAGHAVAEPVHERAAAVWRRHPEVKVHLYGKGYRPGRKLGHVNVLGEDVGETARIAEWAERIIVEGSASCRNR